MKLDGSKKYLDNRDNDLCEIIFTRKTSQEFLQKLYIYYNIL